MTNDAAATAPSCPHLEPLLALEPDAIRHSYRYFDKVREQGPVVWIEELQSYAVTRYEDILTIARDTDTFSNRMPTGPKAVNDTMMVLQEMLAESPELAPTVAKGMSISASPSLLTADPPDHDRQRALVNRAFSPPRVRKMEPPMRSLAHELIDRFVATGSCEFITEFAVLFPLTVIAGALGVPDGDLATFKRWSDDFVVTIGNHTLDKAGLQSMLESQVEFFEYFTDMIEQKRENPGDDLISDVVHASLDGGDSLTTTEMLGMFSQFLVAGNETTTKLLANTMLMLLEQPELMAQVRADSSLIPGLIEESLRLQSPVQGLFRVADKETVIGGVAIPAGSSVWLVYAAGNRDQCEFAQPAELDMSRDNARAHLAFGQGVHYCLGANLSRAEGRIALEVLFERLDDIALAPGTAIEYEPSYILHGLKSLPLTFTSSSGSD